MMILDNGHQTREETKQKVGTSGLWELKKEVEDHIRCKSVGCNKIAWSDPK